jgi:serine/threonine-protein kinase RsbW
MVERRFARDKSVLVAVTDFVREFLSQRGVSRDATLDVELIAEELFTNVVRHAPGGAAEITLALEWKDSTLTLRLRDFGVAPFDVTRAPAPDLDAPLQARRPGGLGLHLIRSIADRFEYAHQDGDSIVTVTKRLAG